MQVARVLVRVRALGRRKQRGVRVGLGGKVVELAQRRRTEVAEMGEAVRFRKLQRWQERTVVLGLRCQRQ